MQRPPRLTRVTRQTPLAPIVLQGYSTHDILLDSVLGGLSQRISYSSIRIQFSGKPGSVVAEVASVERSKDLVVDAKIQNEGDGWAGSGANPWHLDSETESLVFLANMSDKPARIGFKVWASGVVYYLTKLKLSPHETRMIDLRQLRDAQQPDFKGNKIPARGTDGSVLWNRFDNMPVMGRVAVVNRHGGVSSAYDCCTCTCPLQYGAMYISPGGATMLPGQQCQMTAYEGSANCNGDNYWAVTDSCSWGGGATGVATVNSTGLVTAVGGGTASIWAIMSSVCLEYQASYGNGDCTDYGEGQACASVTVQKPTFLKVISNTTENETCSGGGTTCARLPNY